METLLDEICSGKKKYELVMKDYWSQLSSTLDGLAKTVTTVSKASGAASGGGAKPSNVLGQQTIDGKKYDIAIEITRYGPAVTRTPAGATTSKSAKSAKQSKPAKEYGNIPKGTNVTTLTLDDALRFLPLSLGTWQKKPVVAK